MSVELTDDKSSDSELPHKGFLSLPAAEKHRAGLIQPSWCKLPAQQKSGSFAG